MAETVKERFFALQMPNGEYLREVFEDFDEEGNYSTTPSILSAHKMQITDEMMASLFYNNSLLTTPKYFIYYLAPGRKKGKYYDRVEDFIKDNTTASVKYVTVSRTTLEQVSDVYCRYLEDVEVRINSVPLGALKNYAATIREEMKNARVKR